jgi:hypothetical protein
MFKKGDVWRFAATNAILYFSASTLGAFLCDPLTELVTGRRGALLQLVAQYRSLRNQCMVFPQSTR